MITPFFTIDQDDEFVYIDVKISHIRFSAPNIEMVVDSDLFVFSLSPYYLRLRFPHSCVDDERASSRYDSSSECVKIKLPKEVKGQFFPDLDLNTKLLARSEKTPEINSNKPLIEELDEDKNLNKQAVEDFQEGEQFNWEIQQEESSRQENILVQNKYGFNNQYDSIIGVSVANGNDINELGNPENTPENDRILERLIKENIKFDPEIYAADYIMEKYPTTDDDKMVLNLINWKNPITMKFLKWYKSQQGNEKQSIMPVDFSSKEQEIMMGLPKKSYLVDPEHKPRILILIICLLFSYHFDYRENEGEHSIESAWTIGKLTPQIACLDSKLVIGNNDLEINALKSAIIICSRRALSYPLHKSWSLILKVWQDVYYNLRGGKRLILKSLLDLKELFRFHDIYYVYDKIWLQDLCSYLISDNINEMTVRNLAHDFKKQFDNLSKLDITFEKMNDEEPDAEENEMIALNLQEVEMMAEQSYAEYQQQ